MEIKKKLFSIFTVTLIFASTFAVIPAYAASGNTNRGNFFTGLIQFIAQKFGLDQNQVQSAVNDYKNQQKANMQQNMQNREKSRLDSLVSQGKITNDQETAILSELQILHNKYNSANLKNLTPTQRQQQFQQLQSGLKSWAQSQGIDPSYVMPFGRRMGMSRHGFGKWRHNPSITLTPTQ